jgi:hypothetical protein
MASVSYLDSGDEMSGMTWGDCGLNAFLCSPPASPFADKDPVFGHEWACFDTHPMNVEAVSRPMLFSAPLDSTYSFSAMDLVRSDSGEKGIEAQDEEVFVLPNTVKKRLREKSKASQRKKARKQQEADSCCLRRAGANKKALSDYRAILDSKTIRLTPDERELIGRYVVLLEKSENQSKSGMDIMRMLRPLIRDLESFCDRTVNLLHSALSAIRSECNRGSRDLAKAKARKEDREEAREEALLDFRAMRGSDSIKLTSDERELIGRYVVLLEKSESQSKSGLDIMRMLRPLIRDLESFCENTAEELQAKIWKIRSECNRGSRDLSKIKARKEARENALLEKHEQVLSDYRTIRDSESTRLTSDERELIVRYIALLEKSENQRKLGLDITRILQPLIKDLGSIYRMSAKSLQSKLCRIRSEYNRGDRDLTKTKAR